MAGDFNVIAHLSESSNYNGSQNFNGDTKDFLECLHGIAVLDHVTSGPTFTWSNKQQGNYIAKKLDRVLINEVWLSNFPNSKVEFLPPGVFDHCSAYIQLSSSEFSPPTPFKIFNYWANHPEFLATLQNSW
ncbi:hypothetical protein DITRI_Ditri01bG0069900 [Diplodiscus trichospermus]